MNKILVFLSLTTAVLSMYGSSPFSNLKSVAGSRRHLGMPAQAPPREVKKEKPKMTDNHLYFIHKHVDHVKTLRSRLRVLSNPSIKEDPIKIRNELNSLLKLVKQSGLLRNQGKLLKRVKIDKGLNNNNPTDCFVRELKLFMDKLIDAMDSLKSLNLIQVQKDVSDMMKIAQDAANCWQ